MRPRRDAVLAGVITSVIIRAVPASPVPHVPVSPTSVKITTVGNSLGIVLPREVLQRLRVDKGDQLWLVETRGGVELLTHDPALLAQMEALERAARADRTVLRGLAALAPAQPTVPALAQPALPAQLAPVAQPTAGPALPAQPPRSGDV
jgi:putative addiction module antidote